MFSTVPGFVKPSNFLRSARLAYVSVIAADMAFSVRNERGDEDFSWMVISAMFRRGCREASDNDPVPSNRAQAIKKAL